MACREIRERLPTARLAGPECAPARRRIAARRHVRARLAEHAAAARFHTRARNAATAAALFPTRARKAHRAKADGLAKLARNLANEARNRVRNRIAENRARLSARQIQLLARTRNGNIGKTALFFQARFVLRGIRMREQRFFHARDEHHVELQALRRVHRHKRDGGIVFGHGVQIGAQANPLDEVGQRIG